MNPKISIIIPVYNVEKYLRKCLDSCVNQTFKDIEIIVVNDCSPDNSDVIMREYEQKYPQIVKCIYLDKNIKQGGARNRGIEIAQGEYILFVDSDDWIAENMCEEMYKSAKTNDADLVVCDYEHVYDENIYNMRYSYNVKQKFNIELKYIFGQNKTVVVWNKLLKKDLICDSVFLFPENCFYEDLVTSGIWFMNAHIINYVDQSLYFYYTRLNSVMNEVKNISNRMQFINAILMFVKNIIKSDNLYNKLAWQVIFDRLYQAITEFAIYYNHYGKENLEFFKKKLKKLVPDIEGFLVNADLSDDFKVQIIKKFLETDNYIDRLCSSERFNNKNICIWGNGYWGKNIVTYLKQFDIVPLCIIDSNVDMQGTYTTENIPIISFDDAKDKCDTIVVAIKNENVYEEIKEQVNKINPNIEVKHFIELFTI